MARKVKYLLTVNRTSRALRLDPDIYDNVDSILGLRKAPEGDKSESTSFAELTKNGQAIGISVTVKTSTGTYRRRKLVCDLDSVVSAIANLPDKKIETLEIISAGFPRNRRLG